MKEDVKYPNYICRLNKPFIISEVYVYDLLIEGTHEKDVLVVVMELQYDFVVKHLEPLQCFLEYM